MSKASGATNKIKSDASKIGELISDHIRKNAPNTCPEQLSEIKTIAISTLTRLLTEHASQSGYPHSLSEKSCLAIRDTWFDRMKKHVTFGQSHIMLIENNGGLIEVKPDIVQFVQGRLSHSHEQQDLTDYRSLTDSVPLRASHSLREEVYTHVLGSHRSKELANSIMNALKKKGHPMPLGPKSVKREAHQLAGLLVDKLKEFGQFDMIKLNDTQWKDFVSKAVTLFAENAPPVKSKALFFTQIDFKSFKEHFNEHYGEILKRAFSGEGSPKGVLAPYHPYHMNDQQPVAVAPLYHAEISEKEEHEKHAYEAAHHPAADDIKSRTRSHSHAEGKHGTAESSWHSRVSNQRESSVSSRVSSSVEGRISISQPGAPSQRS